MRWQGNYKGIINATWLRWATLSGELLPTSEEIANQECFLETKVQSRLGIGALGIL